MWPVQYLCVIHSEDKIDAIFEGGMEPANELNHLVLVYPVHSYTSTLP